MKIDQPPPNLIELMIKMDKTIADGFNATIAWLKRLNTDWIDRDSAENKNIREKLAAVIHDIWCNWFKHQHDAERIYWNEMDDKDAISAASNQIYRWERQSKIIYENLPEDEKEKDRIIVDKILLKLLVDD